MHVSKTCVRQAILEYPSQKYYLKPAGTHGQERAEIDMNSRLQRAMHLFQNKPTSICLTSVLLLLHSVNTILLCFKSVALLLLQRHTMVCLQPQAPREILRTGAFQQLEATAQRHAGRWSAWNPGSGTTGATTLGNQWAWAQEISGTTAETRNNGSSVVMCHVCWLFLLSIGHVNSLVSGKLSIAAPTQPARR